MIEIGTAVFFILAISVLFVYRWSRAGYSSILFFNKELDTDSRYDSAEKIRVAQVALGFLYFIVHSLTLFGLKNTLIFFFSSFLISLFLEIVGNFIEASRKKFTDFRQFIYLECRVILLLFLLPSQCLAILFLMKIIFQPI